MTLVKYRPLPSLFAEDALLFYQTLQLKQKYRTTPWFSPPYHGQNWTCMSSCSLSRRSYVFPLLPLRSSKQAIYLHFILVTNEMTLTVQPLTTKNRPLGLPRRACLHIQVCWQRRKRWFCELRCAQYHLFTTQYRCEYISSRSPNFGWYYHGVLVAHFHKLCNSFC